MNRALLTLTAAAFFAALGPAAAHHALAIFDREKTTSITGTVKEFDWSNPHVWIEIVVDDARGAPAVWSIQGSAPAVLARGGWRPSMLKPGDKISLSIHPRKDGLNGGYYADERPLFINGEQVPVKPPAADAFRCN